MLSLAFFLAGLADGSAQSLAEMAKKEKERRKELGATDVKSFDDSDLGGRMSIPRSLPTPTGADETSAESGEDPGDEEETELEDPTKTQSYWRDRKAAIDSRIANLESQLNRPGFADDPANLLRRNRLQKDLAQARSELTRLQEEARRKGVPRGWVR
jgi:hypothetical protein